MRELEFDLSQDLNRSLYCFGGYEGEHNATKLTVKIPQRLLNQEDAQYRFVFETGAGESVFSQPILPFEDTLSVFLPQQLTVAPELKIHIGCYRYEQKKLIQLEKSGSIILYIQPSGENPKANFREEGMGIPKGQNPFPDTELSLTSTNCVENGVITRALFSKADKADLDAKADKADLDAKADYNLVTNTLKGSAAGNPIFIPDISPLEHRLKIMCTKFDFDVTPDYDNLLDNSENCIGWEGGDGFHTVSSFEKIESENQTVYFEDGGYWDTYMLSNAEISIGEVLYISSDEFAHTCLFRTKPSMVRVPAKNVEVKKIGKNLTQIINGYYNVDRNGEYVQNSQWKCVNRLIDVSSCKTLTLSNMVIKSAGYLLFYDENKNKILTRALQAQDCRTTPKIIYAPNNAHYFSMYFISNDYAQAQLEFGDAATEYEPYSETTYTSNTDGIVEGVTSNYPVTTLICDTNGVNLEAEYSRDINKAFSDLESRIAAILR